MKSKKPAIIITVIGLLVLFSSIMSMTGNLENDIEEYMELICLICGISLVLYGICLFIFKIPRFGLGVAALFFIAFSIGEAVGGFYARAVIGAIIVAIFASLQIKAIIKYKE